MFFIILIAYTTLLFNLILSIINCMVYVLIAHICMFLAPSVFLIVGIQRKINLTSRLSLVYFSVIVINTKDTQIFWSFLLLYILTWRDMWCLMNKFFLSNNPSYSTLHPLLLFLFHNLILWQILFLMLIQFWQVQTSLLLLTLVISPTFLLLYISYVLMPLILMSHILLML